jgi:ParB family chromosome partitioning protein
MADGEFQFIELRNIRPNRFNPRLEFRKQALDELADSIAEVGLVEPVIVRPVGDDYYEIVVGERRYRAAQQAGLDAIPAMVRDYSSSEVLEVNLIENVQREDLSALEKAKVCKRLRDEFPEKYTSWEDIAQRIGVGKTTLTHWLDTLSLPDELQSMIAPKETERVPEGKLDYQTAVRINRTIAEPERKREVAEQFAQQRVSWRAARQVLRQVTREPAKPVEDVMREVVHEAPAYLPFSKVHADAIVQGAKSQTSRKAKDPRIRPGSLVRAQVSHFADLEVTEVVRKRLGDFDDDDAKREGGYTLDEFREVWRALHGTWNPDEMVYVITFRVARVVGQEDVD